MTKLNKILNLMVIVGMAHASTVTLAAGVLTLNQRAPDSRVSTEIANVLDTTVSGQTKFTEEGFAYQRPSTEIDMTIATGAGNERKEIHSIFDIRMGKGVKLNEDAYSAQDVIDNLIAKTKRD
ncbi:hypothetical protein [Aliiglaciecola aliphaticivorans]